MRHRVTLPALLVFATTGCSFAFVKGPPQGHEQMAEFTCTEDRTIPYVDAIGAGLFVVAGALLLVAAEEEEEPETGFASVGPGSEDFSRWGAVSLGVSVPVGVSAFVGNRRVNECRVAKRALQERLGGAP